MEQLILDKKVFNSKDIFEIKKGNDMHYNCLIVDDETELAKMTAEYFNMFEVSTAYVESGSECFEFLDKNSRKKLCIS